MITIKNYEQYFLLYTDGELSEQEMNEVEAFATFNPKLAEELEILKSTKLDADENINAQFDFADLYKNSETEPITSATLIDLLHGEIKEAAQIESQINDNKILKEEWELLKRTTFAKDPIVFADKELLYRKAAVIRPAFNLWRIAVAAVFIGIMFLGGYKYFTIEEMSGTEYVNNKVKNTDTALNQMPSVASNKKIEDANVAVINDDAAVEDIVATKTNSNTQNQTTEKQVTDINTTQKTASKYNESQLISQKPTENIIIENKTTEALRKQEIAPLQSLIAAVNTKQPIKKEIIDVDLSNVFAESVATATRTASYEEDESTILYMKTSKLKDTKLGKAFSKIKDIAKSKIGLSDDVSISFHPVKINL